MYTCNRCKHKFHDEPYVCCSNNKKYCSIQCIPENGIDKPYSFECFNLIDGIRDINSRINNIKTLEERIELENEINELYNSYSIMIFGDDEGLFYKRQISILLSRLDELYDKIHNFFIKYKYPVRTAIIIYCDELISIFGEESFFLALNKFEELSKHIQFENIDNPEPSKDIYLGFSFIKLSTDSLNSAKELKRIMKICLSEHREQLTSEQLEELKEDDYFISVTNLYQCVVCREWEKWDQFSYSESLKLFQCGAWSKCSEHNDYYCEV